MTYMSVKEFREEGYLQEVNRCYLHPFGLALAISVVKYCPRCLGEGRRPDTGTVCDVCCGRKERPEKDWEYQLAGIIDARDDPEGMVFVDGLLDPEKCVQVFNERQKRMDRRHETLGFGIQPIPSS